MKKLLLYFAVHSLLTAVERVLFIALFYVVCRPLAVTYALAIIARIIVNSLVDRHLELMQVDHGRDN